MLLLYMPSDALLCCIGWLKCPSIEGFEQAELKSLTPMITRRVYFALALFAGVGHGEDVQPFSTRLKSSALTAKPLLNSKVPVELRHAEVRTSRGGTLYQLRILARLLLTLDSALAFTPCSLPSRSCESVKCSESQRGSDAIANPGMVFPTADAMTGRITVLTTEDAADKASKVAAAAAALTESTVSTEEVKSYYWWEGKVQFDSEWRVGVTTSAGFSEAQKTISNVHSYDLPMIIYDLDSVTADHKYWKGLLTCGSEDAAIALAKVLVEKRVVACAQATVAGTLSVKTVAPCKSAVEQSAGQVSVEWIPINGNEGYLKWVEEECVAAQSKS